MKKEFIKLTLLVTIVFSLNACSTPEERAVVVEGADTSSATISTSTDSLSGTQNNTNSTSQSDSASIAGDSSKTNEKMESFRHTPIDTITSLRDSTKQ